MTVVWERGLPDDGFFERRHDAGIISDEPAKRLIICGRGRYLKAVRRDLGFVLIVCVLCV